MTTCGVCGTPLTPGMGHACFRASATPSAKLDRAFWMHERVDGLKAWAKNRIACCDAVLTGRAGDATDVEIARREQEKQTLEAVLRQLEGK